MPYCQHFWLLLSTIKCSGDPFTHICEWKMHSPSSGFVGSSIWIVVVETVVVGSMLMKFLLLVFCELNYESGFISLSLISTTNDYFEWHSSMLCHGLLCKLYHFPFSFFVFPLPFFSCGLNWFYEGWLLGLYLPYFGFCGFTDPNSRLFWCLNFFLILTSYR